VKTKSKSIFWFRRDLRLHDNAGLYHALKSGHAVQCIFIFDTDILDKLGNKRDARLLFIHRSLKRIDEELRKHNSSLITYYGKPSEIWEEIIKKEETGTVFANRDYEPYAIKRDEQIYSLLAEHGIAFKGYKDQVIFDREEVLKDDGKPYTVFTPYSRKWKSKLNAFYQKSYPTEKYFSNFFLSDKGKMHSLSEMRFEDFSFPHFPSEIPDKTIIEHYNKTRDIPSLQGTTRMSLHLRFGTVSIRDLVRLALAGNEVWLNELIWRDFYQMILYHFPESQSNAFKPAYDNIAWRNNEAEFHLWCKGITGYPIVDAGMRELNETGHMHNRVRMIVASFLVKHLLIDWRWGEAYFAEKLLDYDLASNVGGWQWAAGSGCDAAPYFRVFNPALQTEKFDPERKYIKKWVPEFGTKSYPQPMVDHAFARDRVLKTFKAALAK
jgi:deoxyribodipyrimidine photo-lyase